MRNHFLSYALLNSVFAGNFKYIIFIFPFMYPWKEKKHYVENISTYIFHTFKQIQNMMKNTIKYAKNSLCYIFILEHPEDMNEQFCFDVQVNNLIKTYVYLFRIPIAMKQNFLNFLKSFQKVEVKLTGNIL